MNTKDLHAFQQYIWKFYDEHKRPMLWRDNPCPYWVVVSEIMLQQTQVKRVQEKFPVFIQQFPDFETLAQSSLAEVLLSWQGLGYNRRGKYLWLIAQKLMTEYQSIVPNNPDILQTFPGIGPNTAGSIIAFVYNLPTIFIETNIRRVYIHHFFEDKTDITDSQLIPYITDTVSQDHPREWYYALMDYGTYLKSQIINPNRKSKHYARQSKFEGSNRQVRSLILKLLLQQSQTLEGLQKHIPDERLIANLEALIQEDMIIYAEGVYRVR